jgi:hypothetical protein
MSKRVDKVVLQMRKHNIPDWVKAQVEFILDVSNSAMWMYANGMIQELLERLMAIALRLDADGKLEMTSFGSTAHKHGDATEDQIPNYIQNVFIPESRAGGTWYSGTNYAKAVQTASGGKYMGAMDKAKGFFKKLMGQSAFTDFPKLNIMMSDGQDMGDHDAFIDQLTAAKDEYWLLVGVGEARCFGLMQKAADQLPNVGFVHFEDLTVSDDKMYEMMLAKECLDFLVARQPQKQ